LVIPSHNISSLGVYYHLIKIKVVFNDHIMKNYTILHLISLAVQLSHS
jgi:hypothetical protein